MRLAWFFILSASLHTAALLYPVSFTPRGQEQLLQVTILPETADEGAGAPGNRGGAGSAQASSSKAPHPLARHHSEEKKSVQDLEPRPKPPEALPSFNAGSSVRLSSLAKEPETNGDETSNHIGQNDVGLGGTNVGAGNDGLGASRTDTAPGNGKGHGTGLGEHPAALTQVRYRDTPRPDYPESARREGRQGGVLLRVLVDEQGRSKKIEINRSSGSEALDRAAAEAIKHWRFIPARYGDQPVESWIRIPIDFSLADGKAR
jgi:protein TonB